MSSAVSSWYTKKNNIFQICIQQKKKIVTDQFLYVIKEDNPNPNPRPSNY